MRRRELLIIGFLFGVAFAIPPVLRRLPSKFEFEPIADFPGFRRLTAGRVSGSVDPFVGLAERMPEQASLPTDISKNPCLALFGTNQWPAGVVPIAIFNDFNCPYCRSLEARLMARADADPRINLTWRDMPLLGEGSSRAARAALAARFADKERAAREYLWANGLRPGPAAQAAMADALGLDADWFRREMRTRRVLAALTESLALGQRLGVFGTPGTVIGRTLVIGDMNAADLDQLIEIERTAGPVNCA